MNRFWLKISIAAVLVVVVFVGAYVFWPVEMKTAAGSGAPRQVLKEGKLDLKAQPKVSVDESRIPRPYGKNAQNWEFPGRPPQLHQKKHHFTDENIAVQYPGSLQARKERDLLRNTPPWGPKRYRLTDKGMRRQYPEVTDSEKAGEQFAEPSQWGRTQGIAPPSKMGLQYPKSLKAKKSVGRVRPKLPKGAELKLSEQQIEEMYERHLQYIIEQHKDNPKQAEKLREILLERLKQHKKQRKVGDKKASSE